MPAPFGPTTATMSPSSIPNVTSSTAGRPPNRFVIPSTSRSSSTSGYDGGRLGVNGRDLYSVLGQNVVEEVSEVTAGGNLGWNKWEGSFAYANRSIQLANPRGEAGLVYPVVEFDHSDPLLQRSAVTGVYVYRQSAIKPLANMLIFGDNPSGEIFWFDADNPPQGGPESVHRVLLNHNGEPHTFLEVIQDKNREQGRELATRVDMRMGVGPAGEILLLNKQDGVIRMLVP